MRHNTLSELSQNAQTGVDDACTACTKGLLPPRSCLCRHTKRHMRQRTTYIITITIIMRAFYRLMLTALVMAALSLGNMHAQTKWTELNNWDFRKANETEWRKVTLPHSCNAIDGQSARYYRGSAYYRTSIERSGQEQFLYLMGAARWRLCTLPTSPQESSGTSAPSPSRRNTTR